MTADFIFLFANTFVLIGWLLLFFAPRWKTTQSIVLYGVILVLLIIYACLIIPTLPSFSPDAFMTLSGIKVLFQNEMALLAGWVHYLAFDLFVGAYIVRQGIKIAMPRWQYTLCLPFAFMLGPLGLLLFYCFRLIVPKT